MKNILALTIVITAFVSSTAYAGAVTLPDAGNSSSLLLLALGAIAGVRQFFAARKS